MSSGARKTGILIQYSDFKGLETELQKLRAELSMLVIERDELLYVECRNIEMAYMLALGGLEYKAFEMECSILRLKRKIELIQAKKNRQERVVPSNIEEVLDVEFAKYNAQLNERIDKMNSALERSRGEVLSEAETREMKKLYHAVVKALHPDLHPDLSEEKIQLFYNAVAAYENGDLNGLRIIGAMVIVPAPSGTEPEGLTLMVKEKERLSKLLEDMKGRIAKIREEYPYIMKPLIQSAEKTAVRKAELTAIIEQMSEVLGAYQLKIAEMLR